MKTMSQLGRVIILGLVILIGTGPGVIYGETKGELQPVVSDERFGKLSRGINLSHWFAQAPINSTRLKYYYKDEDMKLIKQMGFEHVRLPLNPYVLLDENNPEKLNEENLRYLDAALDLILSNQLAVIVDLHPEDDFVKRLASDDKFVTVVASFWRTLAGHLSTRNPDMVFLEELNEPRFNNPEQWGRVQKELITAIRQGAPKHTIIANGDFWAGIDGLVKLTPASDANVVYNFHFYEPLLFTHQGATWGWPVVESCRNIPYPSNPEAVEASLEKVNPDARKYVQYYGKENWDGQKLEQRILSAVEWAKKHNVRITCNEFGVYKPVAPEQSREEWIQDVRSILEKHQIGWSMWDYSQGFGLVTDHTGRRVVDMRLAQSLGLTNQDSRPLVTRSTAVIH